MNERGVEVLVAAAMRGQKQARGAYRTGDDALCAMAVLGDALIAKYGLEAILNGHVGILDEYGFAGCYSSSTGFKCPECGIERCCEAHLIPHLNDGHEMDFIGIAHKLFKPEPE